jgi:multimeric flavodoxin WrbA
MKVVAFNGSPRKDGNTATLLGAVLKELEGLGIETELVHLKGPLSGCIACFKCYEKKDGKCALDKDIVNECIEKMREADGIILGSPTYFADLTPELPGLWERPTGICSSARWVQRWWPCAGREPFMSSTP